LKVFLKGRQAAVRVGDQSDLQPSCREFPEYRRHVVVQEEVLTGRPLVVDLGRALVESRPRAAHLLDDSSRVTDEDVGVIRVVLGSVENRRRDADRLWESGGSTVIS